MSQLRNSNRIMETKTISKKYFLFIVLLTGILFSCKENTPEDNTTPPKVVTQQDAIKAISEYALVCKLFNDAYNESSGGAINAENQLESTRSASQITVTVTPFDLTTFPKTIKIDYGQTNIVCEDGHLRRGVINIKTSGFYKVKGTKMTITFNNYYQDNYKVDGTQNLENMGRNNEGNFLYKMQIADGKITTPQNKVIRYEENTVREWAKGEETLSILDDVYYITGTQSGVSSDDVHYSLETQKKLEVQLDCKWIKSGILKVSVESLPSFTIDYGNGECDNKATVNIFNTDYPIVME